MKTPEQWARAWADADDLDIAEVVRRSQAEARADERALIVRVLNAHDRCNSASIAENAREGSAGPRLAPDGRRLDIEFSTLRSAVGDIDKMVTGDPTILARVEELERQMGVVAKTFDEIQAALIASVDKGSPGYNFTQHRAPAPPSL